ncbi:MAG: FprA family A-type flavoprotein [Candidatus Bathyarchaeota archaeon]|nr:MAG: FprA family A-type flavoprotein [Candidatus Bathyarchaeota archaeon]
MFKVVVVFDSYSGFTEKMADVVVEGARSVKNVEVDLLKWGTPFSIAMLNEADAIILGSPVIYGGISTEMKSFLNIIQELVVSRRLSLTGKIGSAFGSYTFSGDWVIRELSEKMEALGIRIVAPAVSVVDGMGRQQPIRLHETTRQKCFEFGRTIAEHIGR